MNFQISEPEAGIAHKNAFLPTDTPPPVPNHSPTHRFDPFRWLGDPGRLDRQAQPARDHPLLERLKPYEATNVPMMFRDSTWDTLRYWALLLDEDDAGLLAFAGFEVGELPDPDEWFART